jgi:hypothetical protein
VLERAGDLRLLELRDRAAGIADEELGGMLVPGLVGAADKGAEPFDPMDQALRQEEIERTVDRRRRGVPPRLFEAVEQLIGGEGPAGRENEGEDAAPQLGELDALARACRRDPVQSPVERLGGRCRRHRRLAESTPAA